MIDVEVRLPGDAFVNPQKCPSNLRSIFNRKNKIYLDSLRNQIKTVYKAVYQIKHFILTVLNPII